MGLVDKMPRMESVWRWSHDVEAGNIEARGGRSGGSSGSSRVLVGSERASSCSLGIDARRCPRPATFGVSCGSEVSGSVVRSVQEDMQ